MEMGNGVRPHFALNVGGLETKTPGVQPGVAFVACYQGAFANTFSPFR